jgi:cholesterol transport system auxiliary component
MSRTLIICSLALTLLGCSILPEPGEPTKKYTLQSVGGDEIAKAFVTQRPRQLIVDLPTLYPPIDSTRIALKPQEQTIDYYADVEWADRLGTLLQESLIYSLQNAKRLRGVSRPTEGIQADYALKTEVRKFYVVQSNKDDKNVAQVEYMVHLVKLPERHIVASHQFTHTQTIPEKSMDTIVNSLNTAHLEVLKGLVSWVLEHMR